MKKMAHIVDNKVVNVSLWDGVSAFAPAEQVVELPTKEIVHELTGETFVTALAGIGWDCVDGQFVDNRPVEDDEVE